MRNFNFFFLFYIYIYYLDIQWNEKKVKISKLFFNNHKNLPLSYAINIHKK